MNRISMLPVKQRHLEQNYGLVNPKDKKRFQEAWCFLYLGAQKTVVSYVSTAF